MTGAQLPLPLFACPSCGVQTVPNVQPGKGPHKARALCAHCGTFLQWVPRRLLDQSKGKKARMVSINKVFLLGTIAPRGVEVRFSDRGTAQATFTLILTELGQDGREHAVWVDCECWGKGAEKAGELDAGQIVLFEGKVRRYKKGEQWETSIAGFEVRPLTSSPA